MSYDALTMTAVCDELVPLLSGARIQRLAFVDELTIALEAFAPHTGRNNVLLTADLDVARVHRIDRFPARGLERDTPFSLLTRKHLRNAHIRSVRQPRLERVFEIHCEQRDASGQQYRIVLIVEAMGRRSNLILIDDHGVILDAARRTPPSRNPRRPVLPHLPYVAPPAQSRLYPEQITPDALASAASQAAEAGQGRTRPRDQGVDRGSSLARFLSDTIAGLAPVSGRELAFRATGDAMASLQDVNWAHLAGIVRDFLAIVDTHTWTPTLALDGDRPVDYAPFELTHLALTCQIEHLASISATIEVYYARLESAGPARLGDNLAAERKALVAPLERTRESTTRRIAALEHQLETGQSQREPLRRGGELILTHQTDLPPGSTELLVDGQRFELDPTLGPIDNAQAYFGRYRKAREAEERVPELLEAARQQLAHVDDLRTLVDLADGMDSVRALRREVGSATRSVVEPALRTKRSNKSERPATARGPFRRVPLADGWEALIGASAAGNATVTFDLARPDDLWLHARGVPGAHVILRGAGAAPDEIVERAAQLAAWHSAGRASGAVEVDVVPRRQVKKIPNAPPGLVRYNGGRSLRVIPRAQP